MKDFKLPTEDIKKSYTGVKVTSMLRALLCNEMKQHLRLIQVQELAKIKEKYNRTKIVSTREMKYIWRMYFNFVLRDFRFDDKEETKK